MTPRILQLIGGKPKIVKDIRISETMRKELNSLDETEAVWEPASGRIILKRSTLSSLESYAGALLHEIAHAICGAGDVNRTFECELSRIAGVITCRALER
jgi:hypothetical protein